MDWLTVNTDPAAIAAARRRDENAAQARLDRVFANLEQGYGFFEEYQLRAVRESSEAMIRLKRTIAGDAIGRTEILAALLLVRLRDPDALDYLARVLREGDPEARARVLHGIDDVYDGDDDAHRGFVLQNAPLAALLLSHLDDTEPEVLKAAIQACGNLGVPGTLERFRVMLERPDVPDLGRMLFWLSRGPLDDELLDQAIRMAAEPVDGSDSWSARLFEAYARSDNSDWRDRARDVLKQRIENTAEGTGFFRGDRLGMLETLADTSEPSDSAWLEAAAAREQGHYAKILLAALVRLEGDSGRKRIITMLQDPEQRPMAIDVVANVYAGTGDGDWANRLTALAPEVEKRHISRLCRALQSLGGEVANQALRSIGSELTGLNRASCRPVAETDSELDQMRQRIVEVGLLDPETAQHALDQAVRATESDEYSNHTDLMDILQQAGIVQWFDAETGMLPCRHDLLVAEFATHSRGGFQPSGLHEQWHQSHEEDWDAGYTLSFVHEDRLYSGELENYGDWYDVERTVTLINRALEDAKSPQRFIAIATGDQTASFVFADPRALAPLAEEFRLPLGEDLSEAMEAGKAYEEAVRRQLGEEVQ